MVSVKLFILCVLYLAANCGAVSFIVPCKRGDNPCVLESSKNAMPFIIKGDKALGLASSDPLHVDTVIADTGDMKLKFERLVIEGLKDCVLLKSEWDAKKKYVTVELNCPFRASGVYKARGKLIVVPVEGEGDCSITSRLVKIIAEIKIKTVERDGIKYWEVVRRRIDMVPIKKVEMDFKNLYNGNEEQAAPVRDFLKNSSDEVVKAFSKPILEQLLDQIIIHLQPLLKVTPASELEKF